MAIYDFSISSICKYNLSQHFISIDNTKYIYMDLTIHCTQFSFWSFYLNIESLCAATAVDIAKIKLPIRTKHRSYYHQVRMMFVEPKLQNPFGCLRLLRICIKAASMLDNIHHFLYVIERYGSLCHLKYLGDMCAIIPFFTILVALFIYEC